MRAERVEHEDPVVLDRLNEESKALLALLQRFVGQATLGEIADDRGESEERAGVVSKRDQNDVRAVRRPILASSQPSSSARPSRAAAMNSNSGFSAATSSGAKKLEKSRPMASFGVYWFSRCAPGFHVAILPDASRAMMA